MRILGIDPGIARVGFGVIEVESRGVIRVLDFGHISTQAGFSAGIRLHQITQDLSALCARWEPDHCVLEKLFFSKNVKTGLQVAEARGVLLQTLSASGYSVWEYTPNEVKVALTGDGRADKIQMQKMVTLLLKLNYPPKPDDAADALALALCHHAHQAFAPKITAA